MLLRLGQVQTETDEIRTNRSHQSRSHHMYRSIEFACWSFERPLPNGLKVPTSVHIIRPHSDHLFLFIPRPHIDGDIGRTRQALTNHLDTVVKVMHGFLFIGVMHINSPEYFAEHILRTSDPIHQRTKEEYQTV